MEIHKAPSAKCQISHWWAVFDTNFTLFLAFWKYKFDKNFIRILLWNVFKFVNFVSQTCLLQSKLIWMWFKQFNIMFIGKCDIIEGSWTDIWYFLNIWPIFCQKKNHFLPSTINFYHITSYYDPAIDN